MANEITEEELRSFREQGVVIFDRRKLHINIVGKDQKGNTIVRYNEEIIKKEYCCFLSGYIFVFIFPVVVDMWHLRNDTI
jgi:hypothetical protein